MVKNGQCLLERLFISWGFVLVHDGQRNPGQFKLAPEEVTFYTKKYRLQLDGEFVNTWATFTYDNRSGYADFEVYGKEPHLEGREKMVLSQSNVREVLNGNNSR